MGWTFYDRTSNAEQRIRDIFIPDGVEVLNIAKTLHDPKQRPRYEYVLKTSTGLVFIAVFLIEVDGDELGIKAVEDAQGPCDTYLMGTVWAAIKNGYTPSNQYAVDAWKRACELYSSQCRQ